MEPAWGTRLLGFDGKTESGWWSPVRALRIVLAVVGAFLLTDALASLLSLLILAQFALPKGEIVVLASMLAFPAYLAISLWAFAERNLMRLCNVMVIGTLGTYALIHVLAG